MTWRGLQSGLWLLDLAAGPGGAVLALLTMDTSNALLICRKTPYSPFSPRSRDGTSCRFLVVFRVILASLPAFDTRGKGASHCQTSLRQDLGFWTMAASCHFSPLGWSDMKASACPSRPWNCPWFPPGRGSHTHTALSLLFQQCCEVGGGQGQFSAHPSPRIPTAVSCCSWGSPVSSGGFGCHRGLRGQASGPEGQITQPGDGKKHSV